MLKPTKFQKEIETERKAENGFAKRLFARYLPCTAAGYVSCFNHSVGFELLKVIGLLVLYFLIIELIYSRTRDNWFFTSLTWLAWIWFFYYWNIGDSSSNTWAAMVSPLAALLIIFRITNYWSWYQAVKHKPEKTRTTSNKNQ